MGYYMAQSTFDYGAAAYALLKLSGTSGLDERFERLALHYQNTYDAEKGLYMAWVDAGNAVLDAAKHLFAEPQVQMGFLLAFQEWVRTRDDEGKRLPLIRRIFNGSKFSRRSAPVANRMARCIARVLTYGAHACMNGFEVPKQRRTRH